MTGGDNLVATPRWEWRIFARALPVEAGLLRAARAGEAVVSDETYLLSPEPGYNVKIRQGRIDIKHLDEINAAGLERWHPILAQAFPIAPAAVVQVCEALGVAPPDNVREPCDQKMLLHGIVARDQRVVTVPLIKLRSRLTLQECKGEVVVLRLREQRWESLSFEDVDPDRVIAAVRHLGLDTRSNTNYPKGLRRILGLPNGTPLTSQGVA
jgi:hypothetical protein